MWKRAPFIRAFVVILRMWPLCLSLAAWPGCAQQHGAEARSQAPAPQLPAMVTMPDTRDTLVLDEPAAREHRAVMLQHLENLQEIVGAMSRKDFERAGGLTKLHLGFFKHREAMKRQRPEMFPPPYHDLAMAHHEAAEELAQVLPSGDYDRIMPSLNNVLRACVACHLQYRVDSRRRPAD